MDRSEFPLSWAVRQYSRAFDAYLKAGSEMGERDDCPDAAAARERMDAALKLAWRNRRNPTRSLFA